MPNLVTDAPITDEELAQAIHMGGRQGRDSITVLQLILDHIPPETRRVPWSGQQDYYRNIPQHMRNQFLERLEDLAAARPRLNASIPEARSNAVQDRHSARTEPVRTWPALVS
jgi:hypothetical protein